ncbi:MAG: energy-coupling factor transporter ATPase [Lachnospiraceae bacterium]|nr:energy-coupling factor transporter ATPase [Lachnospiraceae bacterium]
MKKSMLRTKNLVFEYIRRDEEGNVEDILRALDDVSLEVQKGEFVAILGHNGSGKSTVAKHINALLSPTEGAVFVNDMDTQDEEHLWDIRKSAGMVFQNPDNQIIATVVEEDVAFGPENIGVPTEEIWRRVEESLTAVGMTAYRTHSPNKLSGGQKQRVAIAGIMAMRPDCIILDEPTAMLDPVGRKEVMKTVHELNKIEGVTILLITHYMDEVIDADRVIVMDEGKIVMQGTPRQVFSQVDKLKGYRLDVPQVTELAYELKKQGVPMPEVVLTVDEFVAAYTTAKARYAQGSVQK